MNILQNILLANLDIQSNEDLYVRCFDGAFLMRKEKRLVFKKHSIAKFDTFFNSFSILKWKTYTAVRNIKLRISGGGGLYLKINKNQIGVETQTINEYHLDFTQTACIDIEFANLDEFVDGMLFFELIALSDDAYIDGGFFYTEQEPINQVKLVCVITHFNRKQYLLPTLARLKNGLFDDTDYNQKIKLIIVDNSQNIQPDEAQGAIVIPNQNYGGSGGFMRGLLYAKDNNFTHCLFMDDDASCELDSIKRAYALMQYSTSDKLAVGAILLEENFPWKTIEAGAKLIETAMSYQTNSIKGNFDARLVRDLLCLEQQNTHIDYLGWWFLMFNIADIRHLSFPFYVRGDDALFPITNKLNLITINGIHSYGETFSNKENPLTRYLGFRAVTAIYLMNKKANMLAVMKKFSQWYIVNLFSYHYSSAKALSVSLHDVMLEKTKIFSEDLDGEKFRAKIKPLLNKEKLLPIQTDNIDIQYNFGYKSKLNRIFRFLTLNGLLLPNCFLKNQIVFQHKHYRATFREIFRYKKVIYIDEKNQTAFIAEHDKGKLFQGLLELGKCLCLIYKEFNTAKQDFLAQKDYLTSEEFWRKAYNLNSQSRKDN
ncbi:MAG: glycosyltransferase [Cardiobacteriaceae bacterium]|nr:glycosyltransferase [Cardiobacteriaceae bacterium]